MNATGIRFTSCGDTIEKNVVAKNAKNRTR